MENYIQYWFYKEQRVRYIPNEFLADNLFAKKNFVLTSAVIQRHKY